jgi:hypothetical protein
MRIAEPSPRKARATEIQAVRKLALEKFRDDWQRQLVADRTITLTALKVAIAICWHMKREKNGLARHALAIDVADRTARRRFIVLRSARKTILESDGGSNGYTFHLVTSD